jgi:hypothetical protein
MFKKLLTVFIVMMSIFAFSMVVYAQPQQIDGMHSAGGNVLPAGLQTYVNPGGLGNALIYGYYNAHNNLDFLRVVNTSDTAGIAAKVRFREGRNSNEVLDFFICLSARDQWSGWILGNNSDTSPASFYWYDTDTPTYPDPNGDDITTDNLLAPEAFFYSGTGGASIISADDTKEGYVEVVAVKEWADTPGSRVVRTPLECGQVLGLDTETKDPVTNAPYVTPPTYLPADALSGNMTVFDLGTGKGTFAYNATALGQCVTSVVTPSLGTEGDPTLASCNGGGANGIAAVNYVLTKANEYSIYDVDSTLAGNSDIINTMPTRVTTVDAAGFLTGNDNGYSGFLPDSCTRDTKTGEICESKAAGSCSSSNKLGACCVDIGVKPYDDKENTPTGSGFSGGHGKTYQKCFDVNYVTVGASNTPMLETSLSAFNADVSGFQMGLIEENLTNNQATGTPGKDYQTSFPNVAVTGNYSTMAGIPMISYELGGYLNGSFTYMLPLRYDVSNTCYVAGNPSPCTIGQ